MILHPRFDDRWGSLSDDARDVLIARYWLGRGIVVLDSEVDRWTRKRRHEQNPRARYVVRDNVGRGMSCGSYGGRR